MKHQATIDLFRYWNDLRGERAAPERNDIDPVAIRHVLADTFMLDIDANERFPFRLAGTRVNALFDAEQKGRSFLDLWTAGERRNVAGVLLTLANGPCPIVAGASGAPDGHDACSFELLLLPVRHHGKTHSRILGLIKPARAPAWLGLLPIGPLTLHSLRILDGAELDPVQAAVETPRSSATPQRLAARLRRAGRAGDKRPALRVIDGGLPARERVASSRLDVFEVEVENGHL